MLSATEYGWTPKSGNEWQLAYRKSPNENPERSKKFSFSSLIHKSNAKKATTGEYLHDIILIQ